MSASYGRLNAASPGLPFQALRATLPAGLIFIIWWEMLSAALGIVAIFTIFLLTDLSISVFTFLPLPFVILWLLSAYGFNNQKRWAWDLGMATAILSILISPLLLGPMVILLFPFWIIIWPGSAIYLTLPHPKRFLGKTKGLDGRAPNPERA